MKFNAIFNNSYRTTSGKLMHVYSVQLPEDLSVKEFHSKLSNVASRTVCDNGTPRFNAWEEDHGENPPASIEVWLTKDGRLSNLTAINDLKKEQQAFAKVAKLSGVGKDILAGQALAMLLNIESTSPANVTQAVATQEPVKELDSIM